MAPLVFQGDQACPALILVFFIGFKIDYCSLYSLFICYDIVTRKEEVVVHDNDHGNLVYERKVRDGRNIDPRTYQRWNIIFSYTSREHENKQNHVWFN